MKPKLVLSLGLMLSCPSAWANGSVGGLDSGNIVFKKSDGIAMLSEDLYISPKQVRVRYEFKNETLADIKTLVGFPIPTFLLEEDGMINFDPKSANPLDFSVTVNGKKLPVKMQRKVKEGEVEFVYHWEQTFPAGKTLVVERRYQTHPSAGFYYPDFKEMSERYCIEPDWAARLEAKIKATQIPQTTQEVSYILTTANNWKGPIGSFRLVVDKLKKDSVVSLCGEGIRKISPTQFEMIKKDFRPEKDLAVLFVQVEK